MGSVKHLMMEEYENMTSVEQSIADFFIKNEEYMDFSARNISRIPDIKDIGNLFSIMKKSFRSR